MDLEHITHLDLEIAAKFFNLDEPEEEDGDDEIEMLVRELGY